MKTLRSIAAVLLAAMTLLTGCKDPALEEVKVSLNKSALTLAKGQTEQLNPTLTPAGSTVTLKWSTSDKKIAMVSDEGHVTGIAAGEAVITVTADKSTATCKVTVKPTEVESITLDKPEASMLIGDKLKLNATVLPADADNATVTWESLNKEVAVVDDSGNVEALAAGSATIVARAGNVTPAQCKITVEAPVVNVESVKITEYVESLVEGETFQFEAEVLPADASDKSVKWSSGNSEVLTIDEKTGLATAVEAGTVEVTVTTVDGEKTDKCTVIVDPKVYHVESVSITSAPEGNKMLAGDSFKFEAAVKPDNASDKTVIWTSSDDSVLDIDEEGNAVAIKEGNVTVTATSKDGGKTATCEIIVERVAVTGVEITAAPQDNKLVEGSEFKFEAEVAPDNATVKDVQWTSSDTTVIAINAEGNAKALKAGKSTVTVKTVDGGFTAEREITVSAKVVSVESVAIKAVPEGLLLHVGDEFAFEAVITPENATDKNVSWSSSDPEVLKVAADGKAVALKTGKAKITVTTADGNKTAVTEEITVEPQIIPVTGVKITNYTETLHVNETFAFEAEVSPENATDKSVKWSSANEEVLVIDEATGLATAVEEGEVEVSVTTVDGSYSDKCVVVVTPEIVPVDSVSIANIPDNVKVGDEFILKAVISPSYATDTTVTWGSADPAVASVDQDGKVKALKAGTAVITVLTTDGNKTASCEFSIIQPVESVKIKSKPADNKMALKSSFSLTAEVLPEDASDKSVTWSSSNTGVITIDAAGKATAVAEGTSKITVTTVDGGKTDILDITVVKPAPITSVFLDSATGEDFLRHGKTLQLVPRYKPNGSFPENAKWNSSDESLATVDQNGLVTAVSFDYTKSHLYYSQNGYPEVEIVISADEYVALFRLKILPAVPEKIIVENPPTPYMTVGDSWNLGKITILPAEAEQSVVGFCSLNGDYAGAVSNSIEAKGVGNLQVIIQPNGEHAQVAGTEVEGSENVPKPSITYNITVQPVHDRSITLSRDSYTVEAGSMFTLDHEILPENTTYKEIKWVTSNANVATVKDGQVFAKSPGEATIEAVTHTTKRAKCDVTVVAQTTSAKIGDYYYEDGTISSSLISGKTPVGIVFALADAVGSDPYHLANDHPQSKHGLVVAMKEYTSKLEMSSGSSWIAVRNWAAANGYMGMGEQKLLNGYSNTKAHKEYLNQKGTCSVVFASGGALDQHSSAAPLPANTSGWYLPSLAEAELLGANYDLINQKIEAVNPDDKMQRGGKYWLSTFFSTVATEAHTYRYDVNKLNYNIDSSDSQIPVVSPMSYDYLTRFIFAF